MSEVANQIVEQMTAPAQNKEITAGATTDGQPPATTPAKADDKISSKMEVLIRREAQALARENAAKAREKEVEAKLQRIAEFESVKDNDPNKALELLGLDYDQLTRARLADGQVPPDAQIKKVEDKFEAYKKEKELEAEKEAQAAKLEAEQKEQAAISNFKSEINTYLKDNANRYELIAFEGQEDLVFEVIDAHYNRTLALAQKAYAAGEIGADKVIGKVMTKAEAADKVEEHLEKKYLKAKDLNKTKALWGAMPKGVKEQIVEQQTVTRQTPRTLTNQMSASAATSTKPKVLTDDERVEKAIAYARSLRPQL
jgi:hypothetical protein